MYLILFNKIRVQASILCYKKSVMIISLFKTISCGNFEGTSRIKKANRIWLAYNVLFNLARFILKHVREHHMKIVGGVVSIEIQFRTNVF
ncbi:hypothetical protein VME0621_03582 [Vibrio mediterranei]|nr:hypothetical protein VME0621_03582 [Vibrio mediterranei]